MTGAVFPRALFPSHALIALLAAVSWGGGDFAGGMGVKVSGGGVRASLRVITIAHATSLLALLAAFRLTRGGLPHGAPVLWALLAGLVAGLSITAFYIALASGTMGASAALSGLLAAAIPAAASALLEGRPSISSLLGFLAAGAATWLIASSPGDGKETPESSARSHRTFLLALVGGLGFGVYFLLLKLANPLGVLVPIALARTGSLAVCSLLLLGFRLKAGATPGAAPDPASPTPAPRLLLGLTPAAFRWALGVAVLDTGGNLLYVASTRLGRLDVAAVLASLYPAGTILLAAFYLHERPSPPQLAGMVCAVVAVVLVTL